MRISNARTIADIEYVVDPPSQGSDLAAWTACGISCRRDRLRYSGGNYSFSFELLHLHNDARHRGWHVVIISELWRFEGMRGEPRVTKSLRVLRGKVADVLA
jgi:hypothetical protein